MAKTVEDYISEKTQWSAELERLRKLALATGFEETVKWGAPCYRAGGRNVVGLGAFKSYVGLWFYEGANMTDPDGVLINAQPGKTKLLRQWRFTDPADIDESQIRPYLEEARALAES